MKQKAINNFNMPDLSKPLNKEDYPIKEENCFGQLWDISTRECSLCAANEVCAIITQDTVNKKVKILEQEEKFLDLQDFTFNKELILDWISDNKEEVTSTDLVNKVLDLAKSKDQIAVVEYIKRLVQNTEGLSIKNKIVTYEK